jgi:hypothetical protein
MRVSVRCCGIAYGLAVVLLVGSAVADGSKQPSPRPDPGDAKAAPTAPSLAAKLAQRVTIDKQVEGTLGEILNQLSERFDLPILIDPRFGPSVPGGMARNDAGGRAAAALVALVAPADDALQQQVKLPRAMRVRLDTLLHQVLGQADATFLVYPDHLKVINTARALAETGQLRPAAPGEAEDNQFLNPEELFRNRPLTQRALVNTIIRDKPLSAALDEIAESTGANIVLAPQAGEKAKRTLTARLFNVPVESAVRMLAESCDLKAVSVADALYVTTPERAEAWQKEDEAARPKPAGVGGMGLGALGIAGGGLGLGGGVGALGGGGMFGGGAGVLGGGQPAQPDLNARLSKVEDQLKGLDDIKKQLQTLTTAVEAVGKKPAKP